MIINSVKIYHYVEFFLNPPILYWFNNTEIFVKDIRIGQFSQDYTAFYKQNIN